MARKKKSKGGDVAMAVPSSGSARTSIDITDAQNGYILNISGESGGRENKYWSKRYISPTREGALVIASSHLAGSKKGKGKKKSGKKKISLKKS